MLRNFSGLTIDLLSDAMIKFGCSTKNNFLIPRQPIRKRLMFKVILIGEISVGKTSLMRRFVHRSFASDTKGTIGADFMVKGK